MCFDSERILLLSAFLIKHEFAKSADKNLSLKWHIKKLIKFKARNTVTKTKELLVPIVSSTKNHLLWSF